MTFNADKRGQVCAIRSWHIRQISSDNRDARILGRNALNFYNLIVWVPIIYASYLPSEKTTFNQTAALENN